MQAQSIIPPVKTSQQPPAFILPEGPVFNPETGESDIVDLSDKRLHRRYHRFVEVEQEQMNKKMTQARVDLIALRTDEPYVAALSRFFKERVHKRRRS